MKERIHNLENRHLEMIWVEDAKELRFLKSDEILQELSDSIRKANVKIMDISEEEEGKRAESLIK